jgi:hypothetical protein
MPNKMSQDTLKTLNNERFTAAYRSSAADYRVNNFTMETFFHDMNAVFIGLIMHNYMAAAKECSNAELINGFNDFIDGNFSVQAKRIFRGGIECTQTDNQKKGP